MENGDLSAIVLLVD